MGLDPLNPAKISDAVRQRGRSGSTGDQGTYEDDAEQDGGVLHDNAQGFRMVSGGLIRV